MTGLIAFEAPAYYFSEGELFAAVTISRTGDMSKGATVTYTTTPGPAGSSDFPVITATAGFGPGSRLATLSIPISDDAVVEPDQQFRIVLTGTDPDSALGPANETVITIKDDDAQRADPLADALIPRWRAGAEEVGSGFRAPVTMVFLPGTDLAFVAEKGGYIKVLNTRAGTERAPILIDLRERVNASNERGLLGLALHPDLAEHPYLYAFYSFDPPAAGTRNGNAGRDGSGNRFSYLSRFTLDLSRWPKVVPDSEVILLGGGARTFADIAGNGDLSSGDPENAGLRASNIAPDGTYRRNVMKVDSTTHVGGALAFGPDGMLYVSVGDGASFRFADRRSADALTPESLNGKILRIDPLTGLGLPDNPFAVGDLRDNRSKVWALGFRNVYTMTFAGDGRLFASETGWNTWEEINVVQKGGNYGWPYFEGGDGGVTLRTEDYRDFSEAAAFYAEVDAGRIAITPPWRAFNHDDAQPGFQVGGIVGAGGIYAGGPYPPALDNSYFFTDVVDAEIYAASIDDASVRYVTDLGGLGPTAFGVGPDGYVYLLDMYGDRILRLELTDDL